MPKMRYVVEVETHLPMTKADEKRLLPAMQALLDTLRYDQPTFNVVQKIEVRPQ